MKKTKSGRPRGRPLGPEIPYAPPSALDRSRDLFVHCTECKRDWPILLADATRGLCLNHLRANARERMKKRREEEQTGAAIRAQLLEEQSGACPVCTEVFEDGKKAVLCRGLKSTPVGLACPGCAPCIRVFEGDAEKAMRVAKFLLDA